MKIYYAHISTLTVTCKQKKIYLLISFNRGKWERQSTSYNQLYSMILHNSTTTQKVKCKCIDLKQLKKNWKYLLKQYVFRFDYMVIIIQWWN